MSIIIAKHPLALIMLSSTAMTILTADCLADEPATVDTSQWKCRYCEFESGLSGTLDLGAGYVSDDSFKFGEYNGLDKKGGYLIGNADLRYRGDNARYLNIDATNIGLDSRSLNISGGKQGSYDVSFTYRELPHFISDSAMTPLTGTGSNSLTLPATWVTGAATNTMPQLMNALHQVDLDTKRKRAGLAITLHPATSWHYAVDFHHESKQGTQGTAGTFFLNATQLVRPVDYETNEMNASASFTGRKLQARFIYTGSTFHDNNDALTWQNPYTPLFSATTGQLALPPDNQFHQLLATVGYQLSARTRATADIAVGRMTQDQAFLPFTLNSTLNVSPLPKNSLNGKVNTTDANVRVSSMVTTNLQLNATYTYSDRDNRTPQADYAWVTTDSFVNAPATNLPYSFTRSIWKLRADYQLDAGTHAAFGFDYDNHKRTFQETDTTKENTLWVKIGMQLGHGAELNFNAAHSHRDQSGYAAVAAIIAPEISLLTRFYLANRDRENTGISINIPLGMHAIISAAVDYAGDDYPDSVLGLVKDKDLTYSGDAAIMLGKQTSMHVFVNREEIRSTQNGSQTFATPDWSGENTNIVNFAGAGIKHTLSNKKFDIGVDYTMMQSRGSTVVDTGLPSSSFPDLTARRDSVRLHGTYHLKANLSLQGGYWYERYHSGNWMLAGITPDTISNVLAFGTLSPVYHVNVFTLSCRYAFKP